MPSWREWKYQIDLLSINAPGHDIKSAAVEDLFCQQAVSSLRIVA